MSHDQRAPTRPRDGASRSATNAPRCDELERLALRTDDALVAGRRGRHEPRRRRAAAPALGTAALLDHRPAARLAAGAGRARRPHRRAGRQVVAAPDHGRGAPLLGQDHRADVLRGARRGRPASARSSARCPSTRARTRASRTRSQRRIGEPVPASTALELSAPSRQPRRRSREQTPSLGPDAELRDGVPLHEGPRARAERQRRRQAARAATSEVVPRETRSYEVAHVNALWHFDFHEGKRQVLTATGERKTPYLFGLLDDCSRVCCHAQWYLERENTEDLVHGLCQGFQKRGLPRALLSDNGAPMKAAETVEGLRAARHRAVPDAAAQPPAERQARALLDPDRGAAHAHARRRARAHPRICSTARRRRGSSRSTTARSTASSSKTPLERYLEGPDVGRDCPSSEALRRAFRMEVTRTQRRSDGTGHGRGRALRGPLGLPHAGRVCGSASRAGTCRSIDLVDPRTGAHLATLFPLDKVKNADRARRVLGRGRRAAGCPPRSPRASRRSCAS